MSEYEEKLKKFLQENNVKGEHLYFEKSVHTVKDACREANAQPDDFVKTICMITKDEKVMEKDTVYVGGGTPNALVKIGQKEVQRINHGIIARISK